LPPEGRLAATIVQSPSAGPALDLLVKCERGEPLPAHVVLPVVSHPGLAELEKRAVM
jgi:hypothetical protein